MQRDHHARVFPEHDVVLEVHARGPVEADVKGGHKLSADLIGEPGRGAPFHVGREQYWWLVHCYTIELISRKRIGFQKTSNGEPADLSTEIGR
jgi:hypothetical protein